MNVCEGIDLKKYMENDISFNSINSDTKFGECFLRDVAENELEGLSKTSVNCIYKSFNYKRVGENDDIYFIKIQMNEYADSLEEEARILHILNANTTICAKLISKFIIALELVIPHSLPNKILKQRSQTPNFLIRPCIVTSAYTNFMDFENVYNEVMNNLSYGEYFFKKVFEFFDELISLSRKTKFVHNDLHMKNIIYDFNNQQLALLDFGRSYINFPQSQSILSLNIYRYIPRNAHEIPVMTDIMCLSKSIVDDFYRRYFSTVSIPNPGLFPVLQVIAQIYSVEYLHATKKLMVRFPNIKNNYFEMIVEKYMTNPPIPIARELIIGIIYLVIYLNNCKKYLTIYNESSDPDWIYLPYKSYLNKKNAIDIYAPFYYGKITKQIYDDNLTQFNDFKIITEKIDTYISNVNNQYYTTMPGGKMPPQINDQKIMTTDFDIWIKKQLPNIVTHDQAYDAFIKSKDYYDFDFDIDYGDEDIKIPPLPTGGRRSLRLKKDR